MTKALRVITYLSLLPLILAACGPKPTPDPNALDPAQGSSCQSQSTSEAAADRNPARRGHARQADRPGAGMAAEAQPTHERQRCR